MYSPGTPANGWTPAGGNVSPVKFTCERCNCEQQHQRVYGPLLCVNCDATYELMLDGELLLLPFHLFEIECTPPPKIPPDRKVKK